MTHRDIYTKYMIEYEKMNVLQDFPSLTEYEVATALDKAYNALIAQKVTGNNVRRTDFEADVKSISDLAPLVSRYAAPINLLQKNMPASNVCMQNLPEDFLYFVDASFDYAIGKKQSSMYWQELHILNPVLTEDNKLLFIIPDSFLNGAASVITRMINSSGNPISSTVTLTVYDRKSNYTVPLVVGEDTIKNQDLQEFLKTSGDADVRATVDLSQYQNTYDLNQNSKLYIYKYLKGVEQFESQAVPMDNEIVRKVPVKLVTHEMAAKFFSTMYNLPWIKIPVGFIESSGIRNGKRKNDIYIVYDPIYSIQDRTPFSLSYIKAPATFVKDLETGAEDISYFTGRGGDVEFELNDTMAEELISLAISFTLENVESARLNNKLNMRGLEA